MTTGAAAKTAAAAARLKLISMQKSRDEAGTSILDDAVLTDS